MLRAGEVLARRYVLRERIAGGGMSVIWRAWDTSLERTVAVKVLDGPLGTDGRHRDLIRREARAAARIEHPNAIAVYDYGEAVTPRGRVAAYVVMQLLDGVPLATRLDEGPLPWPEAVAVARTVAEVLAAAHRCGVVHRDVTAENVMLVAGHDAVKLLDFGIAAEVGQCDDTLIFGTPPYVAPERLAGAPATGAADVYALGVLLFELLTGAPPRPAGTWDELDGADRPELTVPGLPPAVASICLRCLAADPAQRPSAAQVAAGLAVPARRPRRRLLASGLVLALAATAAGVLFVNRRAAEDLARRTTPAVSASAQLGSQPGSTPPAHSTTTAVPTAGVASSTPPRDPVRVEAAARSVYGVLERHAATGRVRPDVAQDVRNQVEALVFDPGDPGPRIESLRRQLRDRQREDGLTSEALAELDRAIVALGLALTS